MPTTYRLVRPERSVVVPTLDAEQRRVVEHPGGPLLVLAGPGTGKTTTLVEAIVDRIENRGARPEEVLALTFSRKAAEQLRDRVTARLGRTMTSGLAATFHSFAFSLVRAQNALETSADGEARAPLGLLSAPEQEVLLGELLESRDDAVRWPASLAAARRTRGFARELADLLARALDQGIGYQRLAVIAREADRPDLEAAAAFMREYDDVLGHRNLIDYSGMIATAVSLLQDPASGLRERLRARYRHVFVDEYQDTDPGQVALLQALAGDGRDLVVVGDPHQSIYGFRGADVRGILDFPRAFGRADGAPAEAVVLRTTRRFGPTLLSAAARIASRIPLTGSIEAEERARFASPAAAPGTPSGQVEIHTFDSPRAETEHVADLLRRAHLVDGVAWGDMAVLVRSGRASLPALRRSLVGAGVPTEVAADETPLAREPAVLPLIDALNVVADPAWLDADRAEALLMSPLAGFDAVELRALASALRARDRADGSPARPSPQLVRDCLAAPGALDGLDHPAARRAAALASLLDSARRRLDTGGTVEEVLWELWSGTSWPERLRSASTRGGAAGRLAHRDLDAVLALVEHTARADEHVGRGGLVDFLEALRAQQIPADTLAERGVRGESVRLLTAHRSKGLEWRLVVVARVQEEAWPDLRRRGSLLRADELSRQGVVEPASSRALLAEERRLFYVACTRARERLVVTAVASTDDDGEQPSRFVAELADGPDEVQHHRGRPERPLSTAGLVAELRRSTADDALPIALRQAAARRLRRLAPLVPAADPATWWGTRGASVAPAPLRPVDHPITLTASTLTAMEQCPARWFLEREAGGAQAANQGQGFGNVVHALADRAGRGEVVLDGPDEQVVDDLMREVDRVWREIPFRTPWSADRERAEARAALMRFLARHRAEARSLVDTEQSFEAEVVLDDGTAVRLRGRADRLELDADGRLVVVDLKTTKYPPTDTSMPTDPQLGLYQRAVEAGAFGDDRRESGGAELWQLRQGGRGGTGLKVQRQEALPPEERHIDDQLAEAVRLIRAEEFPTRPDKQTCSRCDFQPMCPAWNSSGVIS